MRDGGYRKQTSWFCSLFLSLWLRCLEEMSEMGKTAVQVQTDGRHVPEGAKDI